MPALESAAYPPPRKRRPGGNPAPPEQPLTTSSARVRTIPFQITTNANTRTTVSSGPYQGPAVVVGFHYSKVSPGDVTQGLYLGYALAPVSESNAATGTNRPFQPLFDPLLRGNIVVNPALGPFSPLVDNPGTGGLTDWNGPLAIIRESQFFLTITMEATTVGGDQHNGYVSLVEQVSEAALANFL